MNFLNRLALTAVGVSGDEAHLPKGYSLAAAIGYALIFITFPLAFLSMCLFADVNLVPKDWPTQQRMIAICCAGFVWGIMLAFILDRLLIMVSDAMGDGLLAIWVLIILRLALVVSSSWLVTDEIRLWWYRAPIAETQRQMSLDKRQEFDKQLADLHKIGDKSSNSDKLTTEVVRLEDEGKVLPAAIAEEYNKVDSCDARSRQLAENLRTLVNDSDAYDALKQRLQVNRYDCRMLRQKADSDKNSWRNELNTRIQDARASKKEADTDLVNARKEADAEAKPGAVAIQSNFDDASSREMAFEKLSHDRPEIALKARVLWIFLILFELAPLLAKWVATNNSAFLDNRAKLAAEAAQARMEESEAISQEIHFVEAMNSNQVRNDRVQDAAEQVHARIQESKKQAAAQAHLNVFNFYCKAMDQAEEVRAKAVLKHPHLANRVNEAYFNAVENGFNELAQATS